MFCSENCLFQWVLQENYKGVGVFWVQLCMTSWHHNLTYLHFLGSSRLIYGRCTRGLEHWCSSAATNSGSIYFSCTRVRPAYTQADCCFWVCGQGWPLQKGSAIACTWRWAEAFPTSNAKVAAVKHCKQVLCYRNGFDCCVQFTCINLFLQVPWRRSQCHPDMWKLITLRINWDVQARQQDYWATTAHCASPQSSKPEQMSIEVPLFLHWRSAKHTPCK